MSTRALVLGGGGPVGIAWEAGLLAGLAGRGVNLAAADFVLGTSAGSFVGAQLALGRSAGDLFEAILGEAERARPAAGQAAGSDRSQDRPPPDLSFLMQKMAQSRNGRRDPAEVRREIGAWALEARTIDEAGFIASFGRTLSGPSAAAWPSAAFRCTAVDAVSGEFVVWDGASGVPLAGAVASSCSVPGVYPPITLKGRRYIDGGMRSGTNADLAAGHDRIVVVAIRLGGDTVMGRATGAQIEAELRALRSAGAATHLVTPDEASLAAFGDNLMNPARRPDAARAGRDQGHALAATLQPFWG